MRLAGGKAEGRRADLGTAARTHRAADGSGKGTHPATGEWQQLGLPYGPKARLLLMHFNSEAVRQRSPVIPVEDTMTAFFRRLMGDKTQDGRQANMLKAQLSALAAATFRMRRRR